ncbi:hypothetical protein BDZ97DRAFT_1806594 [Flammula alnicola]|nr:hypothetical protein BDZ97DRAFT_1806594 [Flammula alnicola]
MDLAGNLFSVERQQWHNHHEQQLLAANARLARDTLLFNFCSVAALTWVVYDMILCFGKEVSLVWHRWHERKGRHTRRMYVIVRYASVLNLAWFVGVNTSFNPSLNFCTVWYYIIVINMAVITLLPDVMILIRINAVYGWRFTTLLSTASLFFVQLITSLGIGFVFVSSAVVLSPARGFSMPGCSTLSFSIHPAFTLAAWIPSIAAQCTYFTLMLASLLGVVRDLDANRKPSWRSLHQARILIPTMMIFIRHGMFYFFFAIGTFMSCLTLQSGRSFRLWISFVVPVAKIVNAVIVVSTSGPLQAIGIPWMMALYPVLVTRIYLDMVEYLHARPKRTHLLDASAGGVRLSYSSIETSPHLENGLGQITFASRTSLSRASLLNPIDDEF